MILESYSFPVQVKYVIILCLLAHNVSSFYIQDRLNLLSFLN